MKVSVALMVYNEGDTIVETVKKGYAELTSEGHDFELWVIDNHSNDNTEADMKILASSTEFPRLRYQRHNENLGYSLSSQWSFKNPKADYYITVDGDGQYTLKDVTTLLGYLKSGTDVVFSIRAKRNDPVVRKIMSAVFNLISNLLLNTGLKDLNAGFRGMTAEAARQINISHRITFVGPEIFVRAKQNGLKIDQTPVLHFDRRVGRGAFVGLYGIYKASILMLKYLMSLKEELKASEQSKALRAKEPSTPVLATKE